MMVSTGNYMQSHETGTQLSERSEGAEVKEMSTVLKGLEYIPKKGCPENNFRFFTDEKRKVQKDD